MRRSPTLYCTTCTAAVLFLPAKGAYSGQSEMLILVTVSRIQLPRLKEMVFAIDESAFMIITDSIQVYGRGFKASNDY